MRVTADTVRDQVSRAQAREWVAGTAGTYSEDTRVRADVFVFALQTCRDPARYDALDLDQWEFRVGSGAAVRR